MNSLITVFGTILVIIVSAFLGLVTSAHAAIHPSNPDYRLNSKIQAELRRQADPYGHYYDINPYRSVTHALHPYHRNYYSDLYHYESDPYYQRNRRYQDNLVSVGLRCYNESYRRDNYITPPSNFRCGGKVVEGEPQSYALPTYKRLY